MRNGTLAQKSLFGLIRHLRDEIKTLIREEIALAKAEVSEKLSKFSRKAASMAAGGIAAFAGLIIFLAAVSSLLSYAFEMAGLQRSLAFFIGAAIIGGGTVLVGYVLVNKAVKSFSEESLAPEKTLEELKKMKPGAAEETAAPTDYSSHIDRSSDEIQASMEVTRKEAGETADEITHRLTPKHMSHVVKQKIQEHPVRSSLIGAGTGLVSFLLIRRRLRHNHARHRFGVWA